MNRSILFLYLRQTKIPFFIRVTLVDMRMLIFLMDFIYSTTT
uniref:Uncharacterized protein n=1 Tax=Utricularia reniformis TaxID=192314 RepID=A0A1Y0B1F0_9LAMI|nr:hypothetical protein AEK19_MT0993 [Utricularia reniformis]ART31217.1 hypothetical protein AEK19_MT0993 [Utricularia reniformis]